MESPADEKSPYLPWFSKRTAVIALAALGLLLAVFQINKMLSSSFRIEIFGVEVLEVKHLDTPAPTAHMHQTPRNSVAPRAPLPPLPPLSPLPPLPPEPTAALDGDVFVVVEDMPQLIGGLGSLQKRIRYPEIARKAGLEGRVIVQFVVDKRGRVDEAHVVRGIGGGCDEEALRVVRQARFRPGKQSGKPVPVKMALPVTFKLG